MKIRTTMAAVTAAAILSASASAYAQNPYAKEDNTWISISGTVVSATPESFILDYGKGNITVEMDDWDWYSEGSLLKAGNKVTVYGEVDDELFETTKIEAESVYVQDIGSYFYADADDEEEPRYTATWAVVEPITTVQGTVTSVSLATREFAVDTGTGSLIVDTSPMAYNPLDEEGYQKIKVGDRVMASGEMDPGFFETRELRADFVVSLSTDKSKKPGSDNSTQ